MAKTTGKPMRRFGEWDVEEALAYAAEGGQALHLHRIIVDRRKAPACFVRAVDRGEDIAHLFDRDGLRLVATVRRLGVRVVVVERRGQPGQHVDLCGGPLRKALALCEEDLFRGQNVDRVDGPCDQPPAGP